MTAHVTVIGLDGGALPADAVTALESASLVVGGRRHLALLEAMAQTPAVPEVIEMGDVAAALDKVVAHLGHSVVLASGDPGFFGIVRSLRERGAAPRVLPAVSSVAGAFARVGLSWDDAVVVSAHGRPLGPVAAACRAHGKVAVLTAPGAGPAELGALLVGSGRRLVVATSLGTEDESVVDVSPAEAASRSWPDPSVVLVLDPEGTPVARGWIAGGVRVPAGWALPDSDFDHRDSMVTKAAVRALVLARLAPRTGNVVWDLGSGSGSVAVECARFGADVVAVERDATACERISRNAAKHGVSVDVVHGTMPEVLPDLREADAVFLGGGGLPVLEAALKVGRPTRVVAALAAVERVGPVLEILAHQGFSTGGTQLAASRLTPLPGGTHRLAAENPVFVLWGERL
jgi:precorrin-6B C5,15-methyltransferase / cobalt-precorrin-6B C5,C15-methyltransferase